MKTPAELESLVEKRVLRGAGAIDIYEGSRDWELKIDLETLDLSNCSLCIAAQLYRDISVLNTIVGYSWEYFGFDISTLEEVESFGISTSDYWKLLTKKWKELLQLRRDNLN